MRSYAISSLAIFVLAASTQIGFARGPLSRDYPGSISNTPNSSPSLSRTGDRSSFRFYGNTILKFDKQGKPYYAEAPTKRPSAGEDNVRFYGSTKVRFDKNDQPYFAEVPDDTPSVGEDSVRFYGNTKVRYDKSGHPYFADASTETGDTAQPTNPPVDSFINIPKERPAYERKAAEIERSAYQGRDTSGWKSLGDFALTHSKEETSHSLIVQLMINDDNDITGYYRNIVTRSAQRVRGHMDAKTKLVTWHVGDNENTVMEASIDDLAKPESPIAIRFANGKNQEWWLVRIDSE